MGQKHSTTCENKSSSSISSEPCIVINPVKFSLLSKLPEHIVTLHILPYMKHDLALSNLRLVNKMLNKCVHERIQFLKLQVARLLPDKEPHWVLTAKSDATKAWDGNKALTMFCDHVEMLLHDKDIVWDTRFRETYFVNGTDRVKKLEQIPYPSNTERLYCAKDYVTRQTMEMIDKKVYAVSWDRMAVDTTWTLGEHEAVNSDTLIRMVGRTVYAFTTTHGILRCELKHEDTNTTTISPLSSANVWEHHDQCPAMLDVWKKQAIFTVASFRVDCPYLLYMIRHVKLRHLLALAIYEPAAKKWYNVNLHWDSKNKESLSDFDMLAQYEPVVMYDKENANAILNLVLIPDQEYYMGAKTHLIRIARHVDTDTKTILFFARIRSTRIPYTLGPPPTAAMISALLDESYAKNLAAQMMVPGVAVGLQQQQEEQEDDYDDLSTDRLLYVNGDDQLQVRWREGSSHTLVLA